LFEFGVKSRRKKRQDNEQKQTRYFYPHKHGDVLRFPAECPVKTQAGAPVFAGNHRVLGYLYLGLAIQRNYAVPDAFKKHYRPIQQETVYLARVPIPGNVKQNAPFDRLEGLKSAGVPLQIADHPVPDHQISYTPSVPPAFAEHDAEKILVFVFGLYVRVVY